MKNKILLGVAVFGVCLFSQNMHAQLKVAENGNVGIKISNGTPQSKLTVGGSGLSNANIYTYAIGSGGGDMYGVYSRFSYGTTSGTKYAIYGLSQALSGNLIGVKGEASPVAPTTSRSVNTYGVYGSAGGGMFGRNYGVFGLLQDGIQYGAGIYGTDEAISEPLTARYAGYFRGDIYTNGSSNAVNNYNSSDARLKTNIIDVKEGAISKLKELHPVQFQWQQVEDVIIVDTVTIKTPHFSSDVDLEQKHYGLIAQDVQKLFPELVKEGGDGYLSVNYVELIPLLIQAVQELSAEVEELKKQNQ